MELQPELTRVLLVDDDEDDYLIVRTLLSRVQGTQFDIEWLPDYDQAKAAIRADRHDIYLVDYRLGTENGLELLSGLDIQERRQPFIILTGAGDRRIEQKAMKMGVADYLVKGSFDDELLSRVLRYSLQRKYLEVQRVQHLMEINRSKDEFISLASHQLRTPATVVKQYIAMVLDGYVGDIPDGPRAMLVKAYDGNELQLRIVNDLLHVAALDSGRVSLQKTSSDIVSLVEQAVQDQQAKFDGRDQAVEIEVPGDIGLICFDELKLRMVMDNLIDNASKYSDKGSSIKVQVGKEGDMVRIAVRDSGVGISQEDRGKLFQKFSRVPNRLSAEVGGSGLGLYWAWQIIDLHGGTIDVDSEDGKGSTFTVLLPASLT